MDQNFNIGGTIGYGDSYLEFLFRHLKLFRLHARLHDAAGVVRALSGKGPGYCYMIGRGGISCLLGHLTGLLFCLFVKIFLPSIVNSVVFWNSMSLIVLDIELTEKNIIEELGFFIDVFLQGFSICPPKTFIPNKQTTWNTSHLHGIAWSSGKLDYEKLFAVFYDIKVMNVEVFAKGLEKCRLLSTLLGQNIENLDDYGCLKIQDLVRTDSSWICSSYLFGQRNKASLCQEESKGVWRMGCATFVNFCTCLLYLCLLLIYFFQLDMVLSIAFVLRNRAYETDDWAKKILI